MSQGFTGSDLRHLLETAFRFEGEDADTLLRVAIKACLLARARMPDMVRQIYDDAAGIRVYPHKKLFRALSRFDQLDAVAALADHASVDVRLAVIHAMYNYGLGTTPLVSRR